MSELAKAIERLMQREPGWRNFSARPAQPAKLAPIPAARGVAMSATSVPASGGAGFDEADASQREYWPARQLITTDGLFVFEVEPIRSVLLVGGNRATFAEPPEAGGEGEDDGEDTP